jgi:hypothetical protein
VVVADPDFRLVEESIVGLCSQVDLDFDLLIDSPRESIVGRRPKKVNLLDFSLQIEDRYLEEEADLDFVLVTGGPSREWILGQRREINFGSFVHYDCRTISD